MGGYKRDIKWVRERKQREREREREILIILLVFSSLSFCFGSMVVSGNIEH